jgi:hypothetical protein
MGPQFDVIDFVVGFMLDPHELVRDLKQGLKPPF